MRNFYDNIESYLLGELSGPELVEFENALQTDTALAQSVAQHRELTQRLDALRLRNKVKANLGGHPIRPRPFYTQGRFWLMAVSLVFLAAAVWFFRQPESPVASPPSAPQPVVAPKEEQTPIAAQPEKPSDNKQDTRLLALARQYHEPPSQGFVRDATQNPDAAASKSVAQQAAEAYSAKNYKAVVALLEPGNTVAEDEGARFLRANARFQLGQYGGASTDFDALKNSFQFRHEARWNFMLCQLALGKTANTRALLAPMVSDQDFPFQNKALKLDRALKTMGPKQ